MKPCQALDAGGAALAAKNNAPQHGGAAPEVAALFKSRPASTKKITIGRVHIVTQHFSDFMFAQAARNR
jgi:hypothetical protein